MDLTPTDDPDPPFDHGDPNDPDPPFDHGDPNDPDPSSDHDHSDHNAPIEPWRSNRQRHALNENSKLEKAVQEVRMSAQRKQDEKAEKRKNLADIREEERRNELR